MELARQTRIAVLMIIVLTILTGIVYPFSIYGLAQLMFPFQANGSLIQDGGGKTIGSTLIGQNFSDPKYFHPRPSAAGEIGYDATSSGGSNLGPTNKRLIDAVQERAEAYRRENSLEADTLVPVDAVTSSGSGLDPDITPANAYLQARRVARVRGLSESDVRSIVDRHTQGRLFWILGEPRVNVLELNLALDNRLR